ncbi:MAG: penicillin-binding transpeptidase domain-containing protein [Dethiobacteria bacterium]
MSRYIQRYNVSNLTIKRRIIFIFFIVFILTAALIIRLGWLQLVKGEELEQQAREQWEREISAPALRGSIYDRHGNLLAGSAMVDTVVALPSQIKDPQQTAAMLATVLSMEEQRLLELINRDKAAVYVKRKVEKDEAEAVRSLNLPGITFTQENKRYYPNGTLASQLIGFVGTDQGWGGLELYYEEELKGKAGRYIFPSDNLGRELPHAVRRYIPPQDGHDLMLTIDETIQFIVERELARAMIEFEPDQIMAIAVNPQTGELLAAASKPDFDPNEYTAFDPECWTLSPITSTFEPGSTFKLATLVSAVEEGVYRRDEAFMCTGSINVSGTNIGCWTSTRGGHGPITFLEVVQGSCNPGFITLGQRLGVEKLLSYIAAFGFGARTGIDYPGEGSGIVFSPEQMGPVELATTSFGQGVSVTPLQQVMFVSAIANGGYLLKPYIVAEIRDSEGNVIKKNEKEVVRQIMSAETSQVVAEIMETVILEGSGVNAHIEGYRIAGKTGTAQKVGPTGSYIPGEYILSIIGFLPIDNPQIVLYVAADGVKRGAQWGSQVTAPVFRRIMEDVVKYLGIPPEGEVREIVRQVEVPDLIGLTVDEAAALVDTEGLLLRLIGDGKLISRQTPQPGAMVPLQTGILVYLEEDEQALASPGVKVPDLRGLTIREAGKILNWLNLDLNPLGSGIAVEQNPEPGTIVNNGDTVEVIFSPPLE